MAAIDYGTLIIKDGKVLNEEDELFPDLVIGNYILYFYKKTLTIFSRDTKQSIENYYFYDNKYSYHLDTVAGHIDIRALDRDSKGWERERFIAKIGDYIIIFGYGIDNNKNHSYQKKVMKDYGFSNREKRIISKYLWS